MPEKNLTQKEKAKLVEPFLKNPSVASYSRKKSEDERIAELSQRLEPRLFPFGPGAQFMYDVASGYFTAVEASFEDITGYPPNEVVLADATSFITQLVLEEHLLVISSLILHSYEICQQRKGKHESITAHMEYNIKT